jgi:hypothetical protein
MVRPCKIDTVHFSRILKDNERAVLLVAGAGDISDGFKNLLAIYTVLHNQGFRPGDPLENIVLTNNNNLHLD